MYASPVAAGAGASPPPPPAAPDWCQVPSFVLSAIFRRILENYDTVEAIARHWTNLATVCRAWLHAARITPICLHLAEPAHLADPRVRSWLSKSTLEVLIINRNAAMAHQTAAEAEAAVGAALFDRDLLARPETVAASGATLTALINASLGAAPLLRGFSCLRQLSLFSPVLPAPAEPVAVDVAALAQLRQLSCLTLAGHMAVPDWAALPAGLRHLSVSLHVRDGLEGFFFGGQAQTVALTPHLTGLEFLAIKANYLVAPWEGLLAAARQIHVSANYLGLTTAGGALHDPGAFAAALAATPPPAAEAVVLAFHRLGLFPPAAPPPAALRPAAGDVDLDHFLEVVRARAMAGWDMDPVMDAPPSFVNDAAPLDECFCLTLERQEPGEPRSYHFTTPLADGEVALLKAHPAWRLVWCRDPRAEEILADPGFVAANGPCLARLSRCLLPEGVDLRPFTALRSLHCELEGAVPSVRFPAGLTSLELEVPQAQPPPGEEDAPPPPLEFRKFSARSLGALRALRDLALTGWHRHDLAELSPSVTSLRLVNPLTVGVEPGARVESLGEGALRLPRGLMPPVSARALRAQRALRASQKAGFVGEEVQLDVLKFEALEAPFWTDSEDEAEAAAAAAVAGVEAAFDAAVAAVAPARMEVDAPPPPAPPQEQEGEGEQRRERRRRRRRRMPHHDNDLDEHAHLAYTLTGHDDDLYDTSPGGYDSMDEEGPPGADGHRRAACGDPNCPVHSGKPHLQITFSDGRTEIPLDLSYIVASGFPMVSLTLDPVPEAAQAGVYAYFGVGPSWPAFVQTLRDSKIEVLEINHHQNGAVWCVDAAAPLPGARRHHYLWEGLQALAADLGDAFEFKTWDGVVSRAGLIDEGLCYALVRKRGGGGGGGGGGGEGGGGGSVSEPKAA